MLPFGQLHPVLGLLRTTYLLSSTANQFSPTLSTLLTAPFTGSLCPLPGRPSYPAIYDVFAGMEQASHQIMIPCMCMPWLHVHCRVHVCSSFSHASHHQAPSFADHRTQQRLREHEKSHGSRSYPQYSITRTTLAMELGYLHATAQLPLKSASLLSCSPPLPYLHSSLAKI